MFFQIQFTVPPPSPTHAHTHPTESGRVECLLPEARETGQADHDILYTAEAQVTSAESAPGKLTETQWTLYRGVVERSLRVN